VPVRTRDRKYIKTPIIMTTTRAGCWKTFWIMRDATGPSAKRQLPMNSTSPMVRRWGRALEVQCVCCGFYLVFFAF